MDVNVLFKYFLENEKDKELKEAFKILEEYLKDNIENLFSLSKTTENDFLNLEVVHFNFLELIQNYIDLLSIVTNKRFFRMYFNTDKDEFVYLIAKIPKDKKEIIEKIFEKENL